MRIRKAFDLFHIDMDHVLQISTVRYGYEWKSVMENKMDGFVDLPELSFSIQFMFVDSPKIYTTEGQNTSADYWFPYNHFDSIIAGRDRFKNIQVYKDIRHCFEAEHEKMMSMWRGNG